MQPDDAGFTLLELIIVLLLISLILSLATVFYADTLPSSTFNSAARDVTATLRHARTLAQSTGSRQTITFDLDSRRYWIEGRNRKTVPSEIEIRVLDPLAGEISRGQFQMVFFPSGNAEGGTIVLRTAQRAVRVHLDPIVGALIGK